MNSGEGLKKGLQKGMCSRAELLKQDPTDE